MFILSGDLGLRYKSTETKGLLSLYFTLGALIILTLGMLNFPLGMYHGLVIYPFLMLLHNHYEPRS